MVALNMTTSPTNALQTINNLTVVNGIPLFGVTILFFIWVVIYMRSKERSVRHAIAGASFFTSIIALIFAYLGLIPDTILGVIIGLSVLSFVPLATR